MKYEDFIRRKKHSTGSFGFEPVWMPESAFDFQAHIIGKAVRKGRIGMFADTGLGKTLMQIVIAENIIRYTNKRVLILTPLAVAFQFIDEATRIGVDDIAHSKAGEITKKITVCNYERLHLLNPDDFVCVMLDECFAKGTMVDTENGQLPIENIREGMYIKNAVGIDRVSDVHKREVPYAVRVTTATTSFIASPNHPIFTQRGWIGAQHLRAGDYALETGAAMPLVRDGVLSEVPGITSAAFLRDVLLSEMADDAAGNISGGALSGSGSETRSEEKRMVCGEITGCNEGVGQNHSIMPIRQARDSGENQPHIEGHEPQTFRAWGKWHGDDDTAIDTDGCFGRRLDSGVAFVTGPKESGLSNELQARLRKSEAENRDRGGWRIAPQPQGHGLEEGRGTGWIRVDGAEILEPGNPDLEQLRDADGKLYFYDLGATRHPSYSVGGLLVHNSSILKNFAGKTRDQIVAFIKRVPYRFLSTATPSPNDFIELGNSSEALGYMGYMDMLTKFFKSNQGSVDSNNSNIGEKFYLKPHAERDFFSWVNQWSVMVKKPSDLGFTDKGYDLPALHVKKHMVHNSKTWCIDGQDSLFAIPAATMTEVREEQKLTVTERCERAVQLAKGRTSVYWCNLNDESALLATLDPDAVEIIGGMSIDKKEEILVAFSKGEIKRLITKAKMTSMGLNWQHCTHTVFFPTWSYEQYYQAIRRFWRFGQKSEVTCDMVISEGQERVLEALEQKTQKAIELYGNLVAAANQDFTHITKEFNQTARIPAFLK